MSNANQIRSAIKKALEEKGLKAANVSQSINRGKGYISDFLVGRKDSIKPGDLAAIERELGVNLLGLDSATTPPSRHPKPAPEFFNKTDKMPVYAAAEGGGGHLIISHDEIDRIPRPHTLEGIKEAYGILVTGDSMVPAYGPGDIAWVNPRLPPMRETDVILYLEAPAPTPATVSSR